MAKPIMIRLAPGRGEKRPVFVRLARANWVAFVTPGGSYFGKGRTRREATEKLQERLDALYDRVAAWTGGGKASVG